MNGIMLNKYITAFVRSFFDCSKLQNICKMAISCTNGRYDV